MPTYHCYWASISRHQSPLSCEQIDIAVPSDIGKCNPVSSEHDNTSQSCDSQQLALEQDQRFSLMAAEEMWQTSSSRASSSAIHSVSHFSRWRLHKISSKSHRLQSKRTEKQDQQKVGRCHVMVLPAQSTTGVISIAITMRVPHNIHTTM